jgi:hypothetical protein
MARGASQEACYDGFIHRLPPTPTPGKAGSLQAIHHEKHYLESTNYSKAEYTNTQQDLPVGDNYIANSRHERLFGH